MKAPKRLISSSHVTVCMALSDGWTREELALELYKTQKALAPDRKVTRWVSLEAIRLALGQPTAHLWLWAEDAEGNGYSVASWLREQCQMDKRYIISFGDHKVALVEGGGITRGDLQKRAMVSGVLEVPAFSSEKAQKPSPNQPALAQGQGTMAHLSGKTLQLLRELGADPMLTIDGQLQELLTEMVERHIPNQED